MEEDGISFKLVDTSSTVADDDRFNRLTRGERKKFFLAMLVSFLGGIALVTQNFGGWTYFYTTVRYSERE